MDGVVERIDFPALRALNSRVVGSILRKVWVVLFGRFWASKGLTCAHRVRSSLKRNTRLGGLTVSPAIAAEPPSFRLCASDRRPFDVRQNGPHLERNFL